MQLLDGRLVYSATDLNNFLECGHLVTLTRDVACGERARPERDETVALIAEKGLQHERAYLERLRATHPDLLEVPPNEPTRAGIEAAVAATSAAMAAGRSVIYQGTFFDGTFLGKSDFLIRVERPSRFGAWSYEVADTKLALSDKPYFIIQLAHYSEHLARVQGSAPERMHVVLGNGAERSFRVDDFAAYYRHLKASFLARGAADPYPLPCSHCDVCDWSAACEARRRRDDHLSLVAGMRREHIKTLSAAGTTTLAALADPVSTRPAGVREGTFTRLKRQATLQLKARREGGYHYELLAHLATDGFGLLPEPAPGDVFFDMEGDQFFEIGVGLEYLFGLYCPDDTPPFRAFWGTNRADEKRAFEQTVDFIVERRARYPRMHVYHYAPYEKTALRKLAQRHLSREAEVDDLLREEVLIDLYAVVRQAVAVSQESYSIKKLEPFYGMERSAAVRKGDDSILQFEKWLADPGDAEILVQIEAYNEEDCRSTRLLREWLLRLREEYARAGLGEVAVRAPRERESRAPEDARVVADREALLARDTPGASLLAHLGAYHRREEKPVWWALFDRCERGLEELVEFDKEAIGGLVLARDVAPERLSSHDRALVYTYHFPEQTHQLGDRPFDPRTKKSAGEIIGSIDDDARSLRLKRMGTLEEAALVTALIPGGPIMAGPQKEALARIASAYLSGTLANAHPALIDLLLASYPRLRDRAPGARLQPLRVGPASVYDVVRELDGSYLFVQGPPGTGKTYTGARVIVDLLRAGKRVGVMATGHKAIHNMLHEIESVACDAVADDPALHITGLHKESKQNTGSPFVSKLGDRSFIRSADANALAEGGDYGLISGNGWLFAREGMVGRLDYLVIDEAGQTSLAEAIAVAPCATNLVLLGDPMQLAQVSQAGHGANAGRSVLQHLLGDAATVPEDRGILLDVTYRMHPQIATFISETMYDGRLTAAEQTAANAIDGPGLTGAGLRYIAVEHAANGRESAEEAERIVAEIELLLRGRLHRADQPVRPLGPHDIVVVTPYNAQRKRIETALGLRGIAAVRVGTVDKFQGQEAPVVFYSMATSSGEDLPRNLEFLFEKNRFNVAMSRAQCLSVLVCSPRLLDVRCRHAEQMALVNVVCDFVERAPAG